MIQLWKKDENGRKAPGSGHLRVGVEKGKKKLNRWTMMAMVRREQIEGRLKGVLPIKNKLFEVKGRSKTSPSLSLSLSTLSGCVYMYIYIFVFRFSC